MATTYRSSSAVPAPTPNTVRCVIDFEITPDKHDYSNMSALLRAALLLTRDTYAEEGTFVPKGLQLRLVTPADKPLGFDAISTAALSA